MAGTRTVASWPFESQVSDGWFRACVLTMNTYSWTNRCLLLPSSTANRQRLIDSQPAGGVPTVFVGAQTPWPSPGKIIHETAPEPLGLVMNTYWCEQAGGVREQTAGEEWAEQSVQVWWVDGSYNTILSDEFDQSLYMKAMFTNTRK